MSFGWPIALWGLLLVALALVAYLLVQRRRKKYVVRFTNLALLENVVAESPRWRRHVPPALTLLALAALVVGIARPEIAQAVPREEATVILAMDRSGSMTATDVAPDRMTAAREAAASFAKGLPDGFKVGVVSFSDKADVVVPPTADRDEAVNALSQIQAENGTAHRRRDRPLARPRPREPRQGQGQGRQGRQGRRRPEPARDPAALGRRQHDRRLHARGGGPAREDRRRSGLHGRARHRERHDRRPGRLRRRPHDPRPAGSRDAEGRSPRRPAASSSPPPTRTR